MSERSAIVYVVVFPDVNSFKVGNSEVFEQRLYSLERRWGKADLKASYKMCFDTQRAAEVEKALHLLLRDQKQHFDYGDGKTEMFQIDALETVLDYMNIYEKRSQGTAKLHKGIEISRAVTSSNRRHTKVTKLENTAKQLQETLDRLKLILRVFGILYRYRYRLRTHGELRDGHYVIKFRRQLTPDYWRIYGPKLLNVFWLGYKSICEYIDMYEETNEVAIWIKFHQPEADWDTDGQYEPYYKSIDDAAAWLVNALNR